MGPRTGGVRRIVGVPKSSSSSENPGSLLGPINSRSAHKRDTFSALEPLGPIEMDAHRGERVASESWAEPRQEALVVASGPLDADDQPSHGGSLAKWKLLQKSERKYQSFQSKRYNNLFVFHNLLFVSWRHLPVGDEVLHRSKAATVSWRWRHFWLAPKCLWQSRACATGWKSRSPQCVF